MKKLFNKILVPIDFSRVSTSALEKAVEMANEYDCDIHLLHVVSVSPFAVITMAEGRLPVPQEPVNNSKEIEASLDKLVNRFAPLLSGNHRILRHVMKGLWNEVIIDFVEEFQIDLLLVGQKEYFFRKRKMVIDANEIAERSYLPVITVPGNRRLVRLYSIVIPVTDFLPVKKLMYGVYMAQNHHTTIKLLGIESNNNDQHNKKVDHYLQKSFQLIRDNCEVPVEIARAFGTNIADTLNAYAQKNSADLVIVNPGRQARMPGLLASLTGNVLQKYSEPPVLTISAV